MSCLPRSDLHHGERRGLSLGLAEVDRLFELGELGPNVLFQASEAVLLRGIVDRQSLQRIQARLEFPASLRCMDGDNFRYR